MAELRNSAVRRRKAMLSYMNQDNSMSHLWFRNAVLKGKRADEYKRILKFHANFIIRDGIKALCFYVCNFMRCSQVIWHNLGYTAIITIITMSKKLEVFPKN